MVIEMTLRTLAGAILTILMAPAQAAEVHVHGQARLAVAIDGATLTLMLESPTDSLVGFEHAPTTAKERAAVAALKRSLERPGELFLPTPAAACKPGGVTLASALFEAEPGRHGHADLDGEFVFHCARPGQLRDLEVRLFQRFPGLNKLDVEIAGPKGQKAMQLDARRNKASW